MPPKSKAAGPGGVRRRKSTASVSDSSSPDNAAAKTPKRTPRAHTSDPLPGAASKLLPHEVLLAVARGEMIADHIPTFDERVEAAKAAAPYFAAKSEARPATPARRASMKPVSLDHEAALAALDSVLIEADDPPSDDDRETNDSNSKT